MQDIEIRELNQEVNPEFAFKVVILGDSDVGKTSLIKYEINNTFMNETIPQLFLNIHSKIFL